MMIAKKRNLKLNLIEMKYYETFKKIVSWMLSKNDMKQCMYCEREVEYSSGVFTCEECSDKQHPDCPEVDYENVEVDRCLKCHHIWTHEDDRCPECGSDNVECGITIKRKIEIIESHNNDCPDGISEGRIEEMTVDEVPPDDIDSMADDYNRYWYKRGIKAALRELTDKAPL